MFGCSLTDGICHMEWSHGTICPHERIKYDGSHGTGHMLLSHGMVTWFGHMEWSHGNVTWDGHMGWVTWDGQMG